MLRAVSGATTTKVWVQHSLSGYHCVTPEHICRQYVDEDAHDIQNFMSKQQPLVPETLLVG